MKSSHVIVAVVVCGTLDIVWAIVRALIWHGNVAGMLRSIASGPFGDVAREWGVAGSFLGLIVHFVIMAVMVIVYAATVRRGRLHGLPWWSLGLGFGLILYVAMYRVVLPLRWPESHPLHDPVAIFWSLLPHLLVVGLPMAWILSSRRRSRTISSEV